MSTQEWKYLLLTFVIFIAACIETDIFLPAMADMMNYFQVSEEAIQGLLSWNFVGICLSGPFYGPLSDAWGRRRPLLVALGTFFLGSLLTVYGEGFTAMLFGRVLQGLGSGGCFTLGTAIIFDAFQENQAVKAVNKLNLMIPFIVAAAPMVGGLLNYLYGFRSNFMAIALLVLFSLLICLFFFTETLPAEKRAPLQLKKVLADFAQVCKSLAFWQTTVVISLLFAGYLVFLSGSSILYVKELQITQEMLPFFQAALLFAWLIASLLFNRMIDTFGNGSVKKIGTSLIFVGGVSLAVTTWLFPTNPYLLTSTMTLYSFGVNWIMSLYFPEGMEIFPDIRGAAASFLTSARLLIMAVVVGVASSLYDTTIYPITGVVCAVIVLAILTIIPYERQRRREIALATL